MEPTEPVMNEAGEEVEMEEVMKGIEKKDPFEPRLKQIEADS